MATATKKDRAPRRHEQRGVGGAPSEFRVFQSNGGDYRWEILSESGATLAQSGSFTSSEDAEQAAIGVRDGAASTRLESAAPPTTRALVGA